MLVLSRRANEKIHFPDQGITIEVLRSRGSQVRLGIDAPLEVRVLRDEVASQEGCRDRVVRLPNELRCKLLNQFNQLSVGMRVLQQRVETGSLRDANELFDRIIDYLEDLKRGDYLNPQSDRPQGQADKARTLLVEDDANEREMLAGFLRLYGYQVDTAEDGFDALDYLRSNQQPSVVLMDINLPRCDGKSAIQKIRSDSRFEETKLFAISGTSPEEHGLDAERAGINRWFMKPLNPQSLVDAMATDVELASAACV